MTAHEHDHPVFDREFWEQRYADGMGSAGVNPQLIEYTADLVPGRALDAGCGVGSDAIWLAERGWQVTATDIAEGALKLARERAEVLDPAVAARIDWQRADLTESEPVGEFELVCSHYVHPTGSHTEFVGRLAAAVAPGGTLLLVDHQPGGDHKHRDERAPMVFRSAAELGAALDPDRWEIVFAGERTRTVTGHDGHEHTLDDAILVARNTAAR
ncbi:class I SAM-dependent methyltransferase [Aldersonia kunmingensis]|uniref:class I SAM-dependent methyltransferase n=1 Tax=Aldersonia kunmingensis TaxID=408066 RepID=UPI0008357276|nr:class I SAM-dependent methyltransferase [Aldersonia kunmingensis]